MKQSTCRAVLRVLVGAALLFASTLSVADPPVRVARLGFLSGTVSFAPAGQSEWVQAALNRPVTTGDILWVDSNSRAELQMGAAAIRLGASTSLTMLNLDDHITQMQLSQGSLKFRVRRLLQDQSFEVDTPNLAFTISQPGEYRIEVDPVGNATAVNVQSGEADVFGDGASYAVTPARGYKFYGTDLSDYDTLISKADDDLDRWSRERDARTDGSATARYVSSDVVGYEDLDSNGTWRTDPNFGSVWIPNRVPAGWTPYRDGHWAWINPWGWTWLDDAPWGYSVSHYGRWANFNGSWGWVPGPPKEQAVYAPALVVFVGGANFQSSLAVGAGANPVGWFPLAPREVYRPSYEVGREYFDRINRSNAVIAPTTITNVFNTTNITKTTTVTNNTTNVTQVYANQRVTGAVIAVPAEVFAHSKSVAKSALPVSNAAAISAPIAAMAAVVPVLQSVHGGASVAGSKPPIHGHAMVVHAAPPPSPIPFVAQQSVLAGKPGKPMDETQRIQLKPTMPALLATEPHVLTTASTPSSTKPPPATPPNGKSNETRKAEAAKLDQKPIDSATTNSGTANAAKAKAANAEAAKAQAVKPGSEKVGIAPVEATKTDKVKSDSARADAAGPEAAKADSARADAARTSAAKSDASKTEAAKVQAENAGIARADAVKAAKAKDEATKADGARADAANAASVRAEASKVESARADAAKAAAVKNEAAKADAVRSTTRPPESAQPTKEVHKPAPKSEAELKIEAEKKRAEEAAAQKR